MQKLLASNTQYKESKESLDSDTLEGGIPKFTSGCRPHKPLFSKGF